MLSKKKQVRFDFQRKCRIMFSLMMFMFHQYVEMAHSENCHVYLSDERSDLRRNKSMPKMTACRYIASVISLLRAEY